jgi:undecaprenyl-diphosphatase
VTLLEHLLQRARQAPESAAVARFDRTVDNFFEAHLRGRAVPDRVMYAASAAGEHSMAWLGFSVWEGWRRGTPGRALWRAGQALGTESALVNWAVKAVFRRARPDNDEPRPHHLRQPLTSSFPSGHASSAFFGAALLRDSPWAPAYYAVAVVIASSRVHVRVHHASDVVAGAAVGVLLGEVARRVFPLPT